MKAIRITNSMQLMAVSHLLPIHALEDINKRISDWLSSGGNPEDNYIQNQYRYAENILNTQPIEGNEELIAKLQALHSFK